MSARNHGPPIQTKGGPRGGPPQPPAHDSPFARGHGGMPHPALLEERGESHYSLGGGGPRQLPTYPLPHPHAHGPHPAIFEERLAAQHDDIQILLVDNQRFAATHVALKQELEIAQYELQRADKFAHTLHGEKDLQMRELFEKSVKMETELHGVNAMRADLMQVHMDIKELTAVRQDLTAQAQMMTQDLARVTADLLQVPAMKAEIDGFKSELDRARAAIELQKKGFAESFEHGKVMENKLVSMAREMEKLRAELANAEKRAHATAMAGNQGGQYYANYGVPESGYPGNPYPVGYGMRPPNTIPPAPTGAESYPPQYGPGPGAWGSYNAQAQQHQGPI